MLRKQGEASGVLLRTANGSKFALKEKFVMIYEQLLQGQDPSAHKPSFWEELFLLRVNKPFLEGSILALREDDLLALKPTINKIVLECFHTLKDDSRIRTTNALETLCALFSAVFRKKFANFGTDVVGVLVGMEKASVAFKGLLEQLEALLRDPGTPASQRTLCLHLIIIIASATENVNQNTLLEYFMLNNIFETLINIAVSEDKNQSLEAFFILIILCNYSKYEKQNPYLMQLSKIQDPAIFMCLGARISEVIRHASKQPQGTESSDSYLSQIYNWWNKIPAEETVPVDPQAKARLGLVLMGLYELVYANPDFASFLVTSSTTLGSPLSTSPRHSSGDITITHRSLSSTALKSPARNASSSSLISLDSTLEPQKLASLTFCRFLTLLSLLADDPKDPRLTMYTKLCFITLECLMDQSDTASTIYDRNTAASTRLIQTKQPHLPLDERPRPLITIIFDIFCLFISHNLRKSFQFDVYGHCLDVIQKSLTYQRVHSTRVKINFRNLWESLVSLMRFLVQNAGSYPKNDMLVLAEKIVNVFNLAIMSANSIFPDAQSYHSLFYQILRDYEVFSALNNAVRKSPEEGGTSRSAMALNLLNIHEVHSHFQMKIEGWRILNGNPTLSPEQVFQLIEENQESLTVLKLEKVERFERYNEHPREAMYFRHLLRALVHDLRLIPEHHTQPEKAP